MSLVVCEPADSTATIRSGTDSGEMSLQGCAHSKATAAKLAIEREILSLSVTISQRKNDQQVMNNMIRSVRTLEIASPS